MSRTRVYTETATRVVAHVAAREGITVADLRCKRRYDRLVKARARAARLYRRLGFSLQDIGYMLARHHTTILPYLRERGKGSV